MSIRRVAFRVDAGAVIGTGHWMRCLTLARALRDAGAMVVFISRDPPAAFRDALSVESIGLEVLPAAPPLPAAAASDHRRWLAIDPIADAEQTAACVRARFGRADWLIVDHYAIDARWHRAVASCSEALMAIDDLADRALAVDLVLDQSLHASDDYADCLERPAPVLSGDRHALLGTDFARARAGALARRSAAGPVRRVLIAFGGVDADNLSEAALRVIEADTHTDTDTHTGTRLRIDIVLGAAAWHAPSVARQAATSSNDASVAIGISDMAQRMALADLAFGACGFTSWERCCLGLPTIAVAVAANQRDAADALANHAAVALVDGRCAVVDELASAWRALRDDASQRARMAHAAAALCDGEGTARVVQAMQMRAGEASHA